MSQCVGVVLAGGLGQRMGRTKGDLVFDGRTLAQRAATTLWPFCGSVLISVAHAAANPAPGHPAVEDAPPAGRGPLAGLVAAFDASGGADLLVLACDYPQVEPALLRKLLSFATEDHDVTLMTDAGGRDHPLVGLWRRRTEGRVRQALESGMFKVRALLGEFEVRRLGPADFPGIDLDRALHNLNWPSDLEAAGIEDQL